jgi:poly(hydroxyalkanoate) depolymerase family esterase
MKEILAMSDRMGAGMSEATRLTRGGRLAEATALIQRILNGGSEVHPSSGNSGVPTTIDLEPDAVELTDLERGQPQHRENLPERSPHFFDRITRTGFQRGPSPITEPSPADAPVPGHNQFFSKSYSNQAGTRAYKLYVPSRYRGQALPLIVMLHGCTQSPEDFAAGTQMNFRAEEHNCFVAYPAQPASANASKCWNWFRPGDQARGKGEPALIAGITRQVMREYSIDEDRVYAAGLSAGAAAATILASAYPDLYAAIGVHSGLACGVASDVPSAFAAMRQSRQAARQRAGSKPAAQPGYSRVVPAIVFHGDRDTTVHPGNSDQVIAQLGETIHGLATRVERGQSLGGRAYTRILHRDSSGKTVFEQWVVHGAGHAWSGGSPAGSYTDPHGPDATSEMLRFFLDHPLAS